MGESPVTSLDEVGAKRTARVIMIDGGEGVRSHLNVLGIHIGDWVEVDERAPFRGPILVKIHGARVAIGRGIARKVMVEPNGQRPGRTP